MFIPEKMNHVEAVFSRRDVDAVAEGLVRQGVLQTVDAGEIVDWARELPKAGTGEESQEMRTRRELAANIMKTLGLQPNLREAVLARDQWDSIDARLAEIETACEKETQIRDGKHKELVRLDSLKVKIKDLPLLGFSIEGRDAYSYLSVEMGRIADKNLALLKTKLEPILHTMVLLGTGKGTTTLIVVSLKRDKDKLHAALTEAGFSPFTLDQTEWMPTAEKIAELDGKIDGTHRDITKSDAQLDGIAKEHGAFLQSVLLRIRWENTKQNILRHFRRTEQTYVLSGWVPRQDRDTFTEALRRSTSGRCIVRDMPAEEVDSVRSGKVEVPVRLKNSAFFRPFELLTTLYGTPSYRSIDPTPLVGISYLIMFGIMFGDVGHGLVLALAGSFLALKAKSAGTKDAGRLVLFVGCSSMVFGVLFGSIFGFEEILPHLWFKPIDSIPRFLKTMILFGTGMVTMSVLLSIVNKIRKGQPFTAIFHRAGFVGLVVYWCSIALVLKSFSGRPTGPSSGTNPLVVVLAVCLVLIFFQEPIVRLLQGKKQLYHEPGLEGILAGVMEGAVDILETFLGFLTNTVSFIRVAAFGLAHVGLFMAVFALSDAVKISAGRPAAWAVMVIGNIGIIGMEGLVAGIQALRLEFYEFFNRFFENGDMPYRPVRFDRQGY